MQIVDSQPIFAQSLAFALRLHGVDCLWLDPDLPGAFDGRQVRDGQDTVVILDLPPDGSAEHLLRGCRASGVRVLIVSDSRAPELAAAASMAGADAVLDRARPFDELIGDLTRMIDEDASHRRQPHPILSADPDDVRPSHDRRTVLDSLSPRERHVLGCLMNGETVDQIARRGSISVATVRSHVHAILAKLGVNSQLAAVAVAHREGWQVTQRG